MPVHRASQPMLAFRWNRRKEVCSWVIPPGAEGYPTPGAVVRVVESPKDIQDEEQLTDTFRDLSERQYNAMKQLLLEGKFKSEAMLRDENVASDPGKLAYYTGWVAYADYVISSFESFRAPSEPLSE